MTTAPQTSATVAIVGGGLAGLAAGCALAEAGFCVQLFERRPYLGGRASSYEHPGTGEVVDNCQHVLLGCCTNLIDFYRRIGVEDKIRWYDRLVFVEPGGHQSAIEPSFLPPPMHATASFLRSHALNLRDKLGIARAMLLMMRGNGLPDQGRPFISWLRSHGQTSQAIERFWKVVLVSALNEDIDRVSTRYAALVFRESFLKSREGGRLGLPTVPLSGLYDAAGDYIRANAGVVNLRQALDSFNPDYSDVRLCFAGRELRADFVVLALPFNLLPEVLPRDQSARDLRQALSNFESSPITGIHLWFDRQISDLDHAVLLDRTIQWMFHKSRILMGSADRAERKGSYVELVVSASRSLVNRSRQEIIGLARRELVEFFPAAQDAQLIKATVIKEVHATYSPRPGIDKFRPGPQTLWPRVFVAGDWIQTGWPATMEGAVRSGYTAAEALCSRVGKPHKFLVPDLPPSGLMRLLA